MSQENAEIMRRYLEDVVGNGDFAVLEEIAHEQMVDHAAVTYGWSEGRSGLAEHVKNYRTAFPDVHVSIKRIVASEDEVVAWWAATGTHLGGPFLGVVPCGRPITATSVSFFKIREGKIVDYVVVLTDRLDLLRQMSPEPSAQRLTE